MPRRGDGCVVDLFVEDVAVREVGTQYCLASIVLTTWVPSYYHVLKYVDVFDIDHCVVAQSVVAKVE